MAFLFIATAKRAFAGWTERLRTREKSLKRVRLALEAWSWSSPRFRG
jgi:hypothetical protein